MASRTYLLSVRDSPRFTDSNAAPLIQILTWLFLTFSILSVAGQFATKRAISRSFVAADVLLFIALVQSSLINICAHIFTNHLE